MEHLSKFTSIQKIDFFAIFKLHLLRHFFFNKRYAGFYHIQTINMMNRFTT